LEADAPLQRPIPGFLDFKVNDQRSYDLTAELWIARPGQEDDPLLRRSGSYALHLQVRPSTYDKQVVPG
jgi:hypothetical protein